MTDPRFDGKPLPVSRFAGDPGDVDPTLAAALAAHAAGEGDLRGVQHALVGTRLLIPTAAGLDESDVDAASGLAVEKSSHLSVATFSSQAGWVGLLAFSCVDSVLAWDREARPVPVTAQEAAAAALDDGRSVLVLDFAGPVRVALTGALLRALEAGRKALALGDDPEAREAVTAALARIPGLAHAALLPAALVPIADEGAAPGGDGVVALTLQAGADAQEVATAAAKALASDLLLRDRCDDGLSLGIVPAP